MLRIESRRNLGSIIIVKMATWDKIYKKKGKVQKKVYGLVKESIKLLKRNKVKRILDLGCGTGRHTIFLAKEGFTVYGVDISDSGLNVIKKAKSELDLKNIILKKADMSSIPFEDEFFDAIVSTSVINHAKIREIERTFKEIERVLKKKGLFILQVISPKDFTAKTGKEIESMTRINIDDWDYKVPHHFFNKKELLDFLKNYDILKFDEKSKISERLFRKRWHYKIIAVKK